MKNLVLIVTFLVLFIMMFAENVWQNPVMLRQSYDVDWNRCSSVTSDSSIIYVWSDAHSGNRDLYAQKINTQGNPVWQNPVLLDTGVKTQMRPVITRTSDNKYIIAYTDIDTYEEGTLKAQKIDENGQLLWIATGKTICSLVQNYYYYDIVPDNSGGVYIAWTSSEYSNSSIYGQRLTSTGQNAWANDGIAIGTTNIYKRLFSISTDNNGGLYLGSCMVNSSYSWVGLSRILPTGMTTWSRNFESSDGWDYAKPTVNTLQDNSAVLIWSGSQSGFYNIKAQRINLDGNILWTNPALVISDSLLSIPTSFSNLRSVKSSDNCVIVNWKDRRNGGYTTELYAQKLDSSGNMLWSATGVELNDGLYEIGEQSLTADYNGGCYVAWDRWIEGESYSSADIYAQNVLSNGTIAWQANGLPVCTANSYQSMPSVNYISNKVFIGWQDYRNGSIGIYNQVLNPDGTQLLETNGRQLIWGIGNGVNLRDTVVLPRSNGVAVIWSEYRKGNKGSSVFYQFLNPDGSVLFEPNGRAVADSSYSPSPDQFSAAASPDGQLCIAWYEGSRIKLQLIDANGNRLLGNNGIYLTQTEFNRQENPVVTYFEGAFYLAWQQNLDVQFTNNYSVLQLYGQKIQNGQKQWGQDGILISQPIEQNILYEVSFITLAGRYFVWTKISYNPDDFFSARVCAKLVNPDGSTADGWSEAGIPVSTYYDLDAFQFKAKAEVTDAGLFVCWLDYRIYFSETLYGQLISPQGQILWDPLGMELSSPNLEVPDFDLLAGSDRIVTWTEGINNLTNIYIQKYSTIGAPVWSDTPVNISPSATNFVNSNPVLTQFDNEAIVAVWTHNYGSENNYWNSEDIYYRYITPQGVPVFHTWGRFLANTSHREIGHKVCMSNNEAYVVWTDTDDYYTDNPLNEYERYTHFIYAQKLDNEVVANDDETIPNADMTLAQNYPNPFNPTTNISFTIKAKSAVTLTIYNQKGQKVKTLHNGLMDKGMYNIVWDGKDDNDKSVSSGVYMYRLSDKKMQLARKMVLMK